MNRPKVSIIVPIYKVERYIEKCVLSLFSQTLEDLEYIFVDDCSPDNSVHVLESIILKFPEKRDRIKIIKQKVNKGQASARNIGIQVASGEYIAFVDSDDWVNAKIYEILYRNAKKENAMISCCGIERVCNGKHVSYFNNSTDDYVVFSKNEAILEILENKRITCSPCDKIFHGTIVKNNPMIEGIIFEDFEVMPRWLHESDRIVYCGTPLYNYRTTPQSTMSTVTKKRLNEVVASELRLSFFEKNYPNYLYLVQLKHLEICLNVLSCTVSAPNCNKERQALRKKVISFASWRMILKASVKSQIKFLLLLMGLSIFDITVRLSNVCLA